MTSIQQKTQTKADILPFRASPLKSRRRGRPKLERPKIDRGTPELIQKKRMGTTTEILDICLEKKHITEKQHQSAMHLRWLHTLRHGNPTIQAASMIYNDDKIIRQDDPVWRDERENDYKTAIQLLGQSGCLSIVMNVCIYNETPSFMYSNISESELSRRYYDNSHERLQTGLDLLTKLWKK